MRLTKDKKKVILETTNLIHGCLEQDGVCGRLDLYDTRQVLALLDVSLAELIALDQFDYVLNFPDSNIKSVIEWHLEGKCYRKGTLIE